MKKFLILFFFTAFSTLFTACGSANKEFEDDITQFIESYNKFRDSDSELSKDISLKNASGKLRNLSNYYEKADEATRDNLNEILKDNISPEMFYTVYTYTLDYPDTYAISPALVNYYSADMKEVEKTISIENSKADPAIGMTADEVRASTWGEPTDISKTTTENNVHEMWSYDSRRYIFFDNSVVTSIHE